MADIKPFTDKSGVFPVPQHHSSVCDPLAHNPWELTLLTPCITQLTYMTLVVFAEQS